MRKHTWGGSRTDRKFRHHVDVVDLGLDVDGPGVVLDGFCVDANVSDVNAVVFRRALVTFDWQPETRAPLDEVPRQSFAVAGLSVLAIALDVLLLSVPSEGAQRCYLTFFEFAFTLCSS